MQGIFSEFHDDSGQRNYPFAEFCSPADSDGAELGSGVFVDASLYPINPSGTLHLSSLSAEGEVSVSDSSGVIMTARPVPGSDMLEFYASRGAPRHAGTMAARSPEALSGFVNAGFARAFAPSATTFASSCVFPVTIDGVTSVDVGATGPIGRTVTFSNGPADDMRVSVRESEDGRSALRFDVIPPPVKSGLESVQHVICVVDGRTPFRMIRLSDNTVGLYLAGIDRATVCADAHREDSYARADACGTDAGQPGQPGAEPEEAYGVEVVDVPYKSDGCFYLVAPNFAGYGNPLSVTLNDGSISPRLSGVKAEVTDRGVSADASQFEDSVTSKGVTIQVPGMKGGA